MSLMPAHHQSLRQPARSGKEGEVQGGQCIMINYGHGVFERFWGSKLQAF